MMLRFLLGFLLLFSSCATGKPAMSDAEYSEAMSREHAVDDAAASGAEGQAAGSMKVAGGKASYGELDGEPLQGYLARPLGEAKSAVIMIHEWWGLNDNVTEMANKLASYGYLVLAVDLYDGKSASEPEGAKALMMGAMADPERAVTNLRAARAFLATQGVDKVGVLGWCFGGGWSLEAGLTQGDQIAAVVMYYGRVKTTEEEIAPLSAPLLGIFAALDHGIPVEDVKAFQGLLKKANKDAQIHIYEGVDHAFANPSGKRYSKEAADDAWAKTTAFFAEHL